MITRRGFLSGIIAAACAPAIIRPGLLMPIKPLRLPRLRFTLLDYMGDEDIARIVKLLNEANTVLETMPWRT